MYLLRRQKVWFFWIFLVAVFATFGPTAVTAQTADETAVEEGVAEEATSEEAASEETAGPAITEMQYALNSLIMFLCGVLVFFMQAGFAMVESGFNAAKNTVNILYKNVMDLAVGTILFFIIGYGLMYPGDGGNGFFAFGGVGIADGEGAYAAGATYTPEADWFFQAAFAATAATIVSGAVAGRMQFKAYLVYSALLTGIIYPVSGYWKWGGGWCDAMGFQDFAGSAVVHAVGGFAGLAGAIVLGPRMGRFVNGKPMPMPGHNITFAALGVFILWVGWYGFNPGSVLSYSSAEDVVSVTKCAMTTTLAAGAGVLTATLLGWILFRKPDLSMGLNGALAGLVGITACCDCMNNWWSMVVGGVAGVLVVLGIVLLDKLQIDDPVGAFPVHGLCGIWGCLAIGILPNTHLNAGTTNLMTQGICTLAFCAWAFGTMFIIFAVMKAIGVLRVSAEEEQRGLDISEHGMHAYPSPIMSPGLARANS